jgi:hypothetical protein
LFGAALGVAVLGSVAASLYGSRLVATIPADLPQQAATAARGSIGGALVAARTLREAGLATSAHGLVTAAVGAFLHSLAGSVRLAGAIALGGSVMAAALLPARPRLAGEPEPTDGAVEAVEADVAVEAVLAVEA